MSVGHEQLLEQGFPTGGNSPLGGISGLHGGNGGRSRLGHSFHLIVTGIAFLRIAKYKVDRRAELSPASVSRPGLRSRRPRDVTATPPGRPISARQRPARVRAVAIGLSSRPPHLDRCVCWCWCRGSAGVRGRLTEYGRFDRFANLLLFECNGAN